MGLKEELQRSLGAIPELSPEDIADVAGLLMLLEGTPREDPDELAILAGFLERAGLSSKQSAADTTARLLAYFEGKRTAELLRDIGRLGREELAGSGRIAAGVAAAIGVQKDGPFVSREERPGGTVPAGPAARFAVQAFLKGKR